MELFGHGKLYFQITFLHLWSKYCDYKTKSALHLFGRLEKKELLNIDSMFKAKGE